MRLAILIAALGAMIVIPVGTGALLATSPDEIRFIPVAIWVAWAVLSLIVSLEAPTMADWLTRLSRRPCRAVRYAQLLLVLGLANLGFSAALLFFLISERPFG